MDFYVSVIYVLQKQSDTNSLVTDFTWIYVSYGLWPGDKFLSIYKNVIFKSW